MLIELGNHAPTQPGIDDRPKVSTIHIPEFDDGATHPDAVYKGGRHPCEDGSGRIGKLAQPGPPTGGYTHKPGAISVPDFRQHLSETMLYRGGVTRLPDNEVLLAVANAWIALGRDKPAWVSVRSHEETHGVALGHKPRVAKDIEGFLREYFGLGSDAGKPPDVEDRYWTRYGAPGVGGPSLPEAQALYTNAGRVISNVNDGGGQVGISGTGTAATATTLTTNQTLVTNAWAGYRLYCMQTATGPLVWANVISNNNATGASVLTLDRWYNAATPGGSAAATPSAGYYFMLADGGMVSSWFVALTTTNITPAVADTILSGEYTTSGGGMVRKIAPYAQTSGVASRAITLIPVFTANGSDTFPSTFYAIGVFTSMVPGSAGSPMMKFETLLNASATVNVSGDNVTVTESISGS